MNADVSAKEDKIKQVKRNVNNPKPIVGNTFHLSAKKLVACNLSIFQLNCSVASYCFFFYSRCFIFPSSFRFSICNFKLYSSLSLEQKWRVRREVTALSIYLTVSVFDFTKRLFSE